jgi:DNA-binding NtrC family response regulator
MLLECIEQVGRFSQPVIIIGETGSGKATVARAIHQVRARRVFARIDCRNANRAEIDRALTMPFVSEEDTVFFQHIDQLPLIVQDHLYCYTAARRRCSPRIMAGSLTDLGERAARGYFRPGLYQWLATYMVRVPPLRERRSDIPLLMAYFLVASGGLVELQQNVMDALLSYSWPGNVLELENCAKHLTVMALDGRAYVDDLPPLIRAHAHAQGVAMRPLALIEREGIQRALAHTNGSVDAAAALLGISSRTLLWKLQKTALQWERPRAACAYGWVNRGTLREASGRPLSED